jgi:ubiquitin carboxyl-terminal hydrolase 7
LRPTLIDLDADLDKPMVELSNNVDEWFLFIEQSVRKSKGRPLPNFDKDSDVLLFFKYYNPATKNILYLGHKYVSITSKVSDVIPELARWAKLPANTEVRLYKIESFLTL